MKNTPLALLGFVLLSTPLAATAQPFGDFTYTSDGSAITITGYIGAGGEVTIPDTIDGLPVTTIGIQAFYNRANVTSVTIPGSVTSIGEWAFFECSSLTNVTIPNSVTNIGRIAFYSTELRSVTIPGSVTSIGFGAFAFCGGLLGINVAAANASYSSAGGVLFNKGRTTLIQCPGNKTGIYSIPGTVTSIEDRAFAHCNGLTSVTVPGSVTSIGSGAFEGCTSLSNIILPGSVTRILDHAFMDCVNLQGVYCEGNAPSVGGPYVFANASTATVYYLRGTTGWGATFAGRPTKLWATNGSAMAVTYYVDVTSTNPTPPYTNWATAATNIQDAVDDAVAGDQVVVADGTYRPVNVDKPLSLRSINGPQFTTIEGGHSSRCAYLANSASLSGFTLTNGSGSDGGGVYGGTLTNCTLSGNSAIGGSVSYQYLCGQQEGHIVWCTGYSHVPGHGGGAYGCTLNNCTLTGNSADHGGGASSCTLSNCTLSSNRAYGDGGGASYCTFNNCTLIANSATNGGGGAYWSTLNNCALSGNSAGTGGGAYAGTLNNCTLTGNSGAGASHSTLNNCTLSGNTDGGGAVSCTLNNCTLTGNSGGGVLGCTLTNCIAYFNSGANYDSSCTLNYSCTTPLPASGVGNMSSDPQLASASLLSALSPCIARGSYAAVSGTDIDGEAWAKPPSIGCDEYHAGALTGPLRVGITASITNVVVGFAAQLTALIDGRAAASVWDFGDGVTVSNQPYTSHAWAAPGDYSVVLRAYNESHPGGVSATVTIHVVAQPIHYVAADSANPVTPYASWATAAANIQDAVDAATVPGALVLVTNGTYAIGGRTVNYTTNRVVVDKLLTVRSVNGPRFTTIDGGGSVRCVYLTISATLSGLTLTNGYANSGGGVFCESTNAVATNCVLNGNFASEGGGVRGCTLNNCMLSGNSAWNYASGAEYSTLNNCTLAGNSGLGAYCSTLNNCALSGNSGDGAHSCTLNNSTLTDNAGGGASDFCKLNNCTLTGNAGGGASYYCTLINCIAYFNSGGNYDDFSTLNYCCTTPQPTNGVGNITNVPLFVDQASGNLRLQSNSPCINAGLNALAPASPDLDGNSRIAGGAVDIGAYEFQSPTSTISYAWLQQFNLPINPATDTADPDGDGVNNYHEWLAGTAPTNPFSSPAQLTITPGGTNLVLTWPTNALGFTLQSTTNLDSPAVWRTNSPAPVVIDGQNTVSNPITGAQQFFRLSR